MTRRSAEKRDRSELIEALRRLRDPGGDGKTRVSHGFSGQPMRCGTCRLPTVDQPKGVTVPEGPRCACGVTL
ncbi:MAG TPA: hypothetical protein VK841_09545 [Polyangiaceae bacterium]|jgi:hypothetical protein|nr:hypothetical protein [Polyangiaceae bacterium]